MGWAANHIFNLKAGRSVTFKYVGNHMFPIVSNGELVEVNPVGQTKLKKGMVVLVKMNGLELLHKITDINDNLVEISTNSGHVNGWTDIENVYGIAKK